MLDALGLFRSAFYGYTRSGGRQNIQPLGGADFVDAKHVGAVAHDHQALQVVGMGDHGYASRGLFGVAAFGFGDDGFFRNALAFKLLTAHRALGKLVAAVAAERNNDRRDAPVVKLQCMVEARAIDGRGFAIVLRRAEHTDGIRRSGLVLRCVAHDLPIDPAAPRQHSDHHGQKQQQRCPKEKPADFGPTRLRVCTAHAHLLT